MAEQHHLDSLTLSSYLDGEAVDAGARAHLARCASCAARLSDLRTVDARLAAAADLDCGAFRTLLSADLDREAGAEEQALLERHLATCDSCRQERVNWMILDAELRALPLRSPSARVDRAIARRARPEPVRFPRIATGGGLAVAVTVLVAIAVAISPSRVLTPEPVTQTLPAFVAAVSEQVVVSSATGRIYVLEPERSSVNIFDGTSRELLRTIVLGGRPVAIGINEGTNTVYVLDAESKSIKEIDGARDAVVASLAVNVSGTPTSLQVDASENRLLVTAAGATNPDGSGKGELAVAQSGATRAVAVSQIDVSPQRVVVDARAKRIYVAAKDSTLVLDASTYVTIARLPGGAVDLAVSPASGVVALLVPLNGHTAVAFYGTEQTAVEVPGTPRAITALPDGGFALLVDLNGQGQVVTVSSAGALGRSIDVSATARQLAVQPGTGAFALVGPDGLKVTSVAPIEVAKGPDQAKKVDANAPSSSPAPQSQATTPTPGERARPEVIAPTTPSRSSLIPPDAELAATGTYRLELSADRQPVVLASAGRRVWFVDQRNALTAIDTRDGTLAIVAVLPKGATPSWLWVGSERVFVFDTASQHLLMLPFGESIFRAVVPPFGGDVRAETVTPDGRAWLAIEGATAGLVAYDAASDAFSFVKLAPGTHVSVLQADRSGRVWFGGQRMLGFYDYTSAQLVQITVPDNVTSVAVDSDGSIWAGTGSGYLMRLNGASVVEAFRLDGGVEQILTGASGDAWFVARSQDGFSLGLVRDRRVQGSAVAAARQVVFDDLGRAWYAVGGEAAFFFTTPLAGVQ